MQLGSYYGIESSVLSPKETSELYPLMNVDDVYGTLYSPGDGIVEPAGIAQAYNRAAVKHGAKVSHRVLSLTGPLLTASRYGVVVVAQWAASTGACISESPIS